MQPNPHQGPPTAQTGEPSARDGKWLARAQSAFRSSTTYFDSNFRKQWEDSLRAFNSQHPSDSKYTQPSYEKRSHLYRPKIRSVIRKNEAAAAAAFFSNMDVLNLEALDMSSKAQVASAAVMKQLVEYRLDKSVPWFMTVLGGFQDAQTVGVSIAHVYWKYKAQTEGKRKKPSPKIDKPCVDLVPIENFRFDPSASWSDPIGTSPYLIQLMPMYVMHIKARMDSGEWIRFSDAEILAANSGTVDSTRSARNRDAQDPTQNDDKEIDDYAIVWVQRHIHMDGDEGDVEFYTLGDMYMLCDPVPLEDVVFHGQRPYVCGCCIIETHKPVPSGVPMLAKGLQDEANEMVNQTADSGKFVLNKKYLVKRGKEADVAGLVRNVPGGVVMMDDPINDVKELTWPDITGSTFEIQNRINLDMDELLGNFNPAGLMAQGGNQNQPARNMAMLGQSQGTLVEYLIRTYVVTFIIPILRQLILLEQHYETDRTVLALAANKAELLQRFGIDEVTDELLNQELTMKVNVGMGATDPAQKMQKLIAGVTAFSNVVQKPTPGLNTSEVGKEIFAAMGYQDGARFLTVDNVQVAQLQKQLEQAMGVIQQLTQKLKDKHDQGIIGLQKTRETNQVKKEIAVVQEEAANKRALATHFAALMAPHSAPPKPEPRKVSNGK